MTTSQVAGKGESMSNPEANRQPKHVKEWLDMVAKVQKAETELAEAKMFGLEQYNLHHKTRAERDRLREALEKIHSFAQSCDATPEALLLHIENAARDALAGGSERETRDPLTEEYRDMLRKLIDAYNDIPCACQKHYTERELIDPNCPRCHFVEEPLISEAEDLLLGQDLPERERDQEPRCDCYPSKENWMVCRYCGKDLGDGDTEA